MTFRAESAGGSRAQASAPVDYRLLRRRRLRDAQRGHAGRTDLCDAHPELLRAARNVGESTTDVCPICEVDGVVHVSFAFGPRLPAHGRCITSRQELSRLARGADPVVCYVVEVCPGCSWNHLVRSYPLGGRGPG